MSFASGSLVTARGREWSVLPDSSDSLLLLRPLGGSEDECAGIMPELEPVSAANFPLPSSNDLGDFRSCKLLRDSLRLGFRSSAGPFRSFGNLNIDPRPYQLVPLMLALRLSTIRLLIADGVGIGKTIEALMIARELLDRAEIKSLAVLCPPHLAEQWQREMREKFNIEAELVLSSTVKSLSRDLGHDESLFSRHPFTIVSMDFVKSERNRNDFLRDAPEFIIVDEAHTCAEAGEGVRHQRHRLIKALAADPKRHVVLVTATPHSGNEHAFRSLLALLDDGFTDLPEDLTGPEKEPYRRKLAAHLVQRRRADIRDFLDSTPFPEAEATEASYTLHPEYALLFNRALNYARETVQDKSGTKFQQRIRWWSVLALLRSLASSPAAAAATLRNRAGTLAENASEEEIDRLGRESVLDLTDESQGESSDVVPSGDWTSEERSEESSRARLLDMARLAEKLCGDGDQKMIKGVGLVKALLKDGFSPIVFCRFIPTADYLAEELRKRLGSKVAVDSITGVLSPKEREDRVAELGEAPRGQRVLVCTDCLSEGINLQNHFDAVIHYDLAWNPTRHEQRDGRADRYGQVSKTVRTITYYGTDNKIDGIVLDVLLRKHNKIRSSLGISVPVPVNSEQIVEAVYEGLLLREHGNESANQAFFEFEKEFEPRREQLHKEWELVAEREKRSQTMFAQRSIKPEEVSVELVQTREALGSSASLIEFLEVSLRELGATVAKNGVLKVDPREMPSEVGLGIDSPIKITLSATDAKDTIQVNRTHPVVQGLAAHILSAALDPRLENKLRPARRAGVIRTAAVDKRTTLLLLRFRFHIIRKQAADEKSLLAEDCAIIGFKGSPENPEWLGVDEIDSLLAVRPDGNVSADIASERIAAIVDSYHSIIEPKVHELVQERATALLVNHQRVREASKIKGVQHEVRANLPADVLGIFHYLPSTQNG